MRSVLGFKPARLLGPLLLLVVGLAHAQYAWIDEKGVRHFSDRPPPPDTPADKVLKAPGKATGAAPAAPPPAATPADASPVRKIAGDKPDPRPLEVREAEFRKFLHASAADDRKDPARYCEETRDYKTKLENNDRNLRWLSDEQRKGMIARVNEQLAARCP